MQGVRAAIVVCLLAGAARASTPDVFGLGSEESAVCGASAARVHDFSAGYYDPAGLTLVEKPEVSIDFAADGPDFEAEGRLWGGNLSMLCAVVGTPYLPRVQGGILFLEDVNEAAYRIERMLLQLHHAGILQRQRAIVLGDFSPTPSLPNDNGFDLGVVVGYLRSVLATPVLTGLPFGHGPRRVTLPIGAPGRLYVRAGQARLQFHRHPVLS